MAPPPAGVALVTFGESWRYLDEGTAPATTWSSRTGFDDTAWAQGRARLGYGGDAEATLIGYGAQASSRHITTWFRKRFSIADPSSIFSLLLRLVRDDGAVVFLNGTEILRSNLPAGTITPTTLATSDVAGLAEQEVVDAIVPAGLLVAGENVLAVELHQATASSTDVGMDAELLGLGNSEATFRFTSPVVSQSITAAVDLPLTVWAAPEIGVTRVEYFAGPAFIGSSQSAPYFPVPWTTPLLGTYALTARATLAGGGTLTAGPLTLSVEAPRASSLHVPAGSTWKYWDAGTLRAQNWTALAYADTAWKSGPARLGFGADGEATAIQSGRIGYYFRKSFTVGSLADVDEVALRFQRDDGVVIYLNGVEIARDNMPAGPVVPTTAATADIANEQVWIRLVLPPSVLQVGTNILAAEVHQRVSTSSDVGWDAELTSRGVNLLAVANLLRPPHRGRNLPRSADRPASPTAGSSAFPNPTVACTSSKNPMTWPPGSHRRTNSPATARLPSACHPTHPLPRHIIAPVGCRRCRKCHLDARDPVAGWPDHHHPQPIGFKPLPAVGRPVSRDEKRFQPRGHH